MVFGNFAAALATMQPPGQQQQRSQDQGPLSGLAAAVSKAINSPAPGKVVPAAPSEPGKVVMYSPEYYYTCAIGGIFSCGLTHTAVTPLDVVKCNMQTDPAKYKSIRSGFSVVLQEQGAAGLLRGWLPTLLGYSAQGAFKFGLVGWWEGGLVPLPPPPGEPASPAGRGGSRGMASRAGRRRRGSRRDRRRGSGGEWRLAGDGSAPVLRPGQGGRTPPLTNPALPTTCCCRRRRLRAWLTWLLLSAVRVLQKVSRAAKGSDSKTALQLLCLAMSGCLVCEQLDRL
jgi:hypothetical protein